MLNSLYTRFILITVAFATQALQAQWTGFSDPAYDGITQYSEWEHFITTNNATPDVANGTNGSLSETTGAGFPSSTLNIYSYSLDTQFSIYGSSTNDLGQLNLQFVIWGSEDFLNLEPLLQVTGSKTGIAADSSNHASDGTIYIEGQGDIEITVFSFFWDLSEYIVTDYQIDFGLAVHTSLDKVRIDTRTGTLVTEPEPIVPIEVTTSIVDDDIALNFPTYSGNYYQIKWTDDLTSAGTVNNWNDLGTLIAGNGAVQQIIDPDSSEDEQRFYSIIITN
ncbi:hypothetical protein SH580_07575 [Coraliomargarita algicola]|uniref:Uncharacterized protein n=1 Tax=Coraliomargarita algicola TaxID=3092156 RepID=A0ABZ0RRN4_9BACT|nr:hypothetical protein [Coraliomargarita sp. J2-16]WPJ97567.1 hypothetical protein SH580_07575 [Coraliomargarita sp. J2-16]